MVRFEAALQALPTRLAPFGTGWPGSKWEWDGRLDCALSTIATAQAPQVQSVLTAALPALWTSASLAGAPPLIQQICARTGGLLPQQQAFSAELPDGVYVYGLWWPWGSGANVSVRLGTSHESVTPALRAAFGV
jgi:hypothetical protein